MKTIAVSGISGFVGTNLKRHFEQLGYKVIGIKRDDLKNIEKLTDIIDISDIVINLAGANIINRWTDSYKKLLYSSRIDTTQALVEAMNEANSKPKLFISTSAIGIYKNNDCFDEENYKLEDNFLARLCKSWENSALRAESLGIRTSIFRFGIVLGKGGGALQKMLPPFKLGLGGTIGKGSQYFSFIHIDDLLNAYSFIIENEDCSGIFNLTAPISTTNLGLTKALGKVLHRPTIIPIPQFALNLIFSEGAKVLTDGQCVSPQKLLDKGFKFKFDTIEKSLENII